MSRLFLTSIDLAKNELQNARIQNLASAPGSPVLGQTYFDTVLNAPRFWDGTAFSNKATDSLLLQGQNSAYHLNRGNHTGTQLAATISDLAATVQSYRLDQFAAPTSPLNVNSQRITNVATPTAANDAANKSYVDAAIQGLDQKPAAQVATVAALPSSTYNNGSGGVGATLTATANGALTVDGYAVQTNDRVLVKNQASSFQNGLYSVTAPGSAGTAFVLTRDTQMDSATEFGGAFVPVENNGATTANTMWLANVAESITVGTTAVPFTQLNGATSLVAGNGISISGNTITAVAAPSGGVTVGGSGIALDTAIAVRKYATNVGDGSSTSITVTHNLGTLDVQAIIFANSGGAEVLCDVTHATTNTLTLQFAVAPTSNQYRCVVQG